MQLRQENEALREQLQHSMIPDRVDEPMTDSSKEEIGSLKVFLLKLPFTSLSVEYSLSTFDIVEFHLTTNNR